VTIVPPGLHEKLLCAYSWPGSPKLIAAKGHNILKVIKKIPKTCDSGPLSLGIDSHVQI